MEIVLDPPIEKPKILLPPAIDITQTTPEHARLSEPAVDSGSNPGSSLDGLLIWICINCWLLLVGMHVYELLYWILG